MIIAEVCDPQSSGMGNDEQRAAAGAHSSRSSDQLERQGSLMHSSQDEFQHMMQLTQLLESLIRVMVRPNSPNDKDSWLPADTGCCSLLSYQAEERREVFHAPTIEDTRPALNLPSCCMNYRIGLTTTLFGTITTVMATSLYSLFKSLW